MYPTTFYGMQKTDRARNIDSFGKKLIQCDEEARTAGSKSEPGFTTFAEVQRSDRAMIGVRERVCSA